MINECCKDLAMAIVMQAYKDYCFLAKKCRKFPRYKGTYIAEMKEIIGFVESEWFTILTDIPQRKMLARLKEVYDIDDE